MITFMRFFGYAQNDDWDTRNDDHARGNFGDARSD